MNARQFCQRRLLISALASLALLGACSTPQPLNTTSLDVWHGRMALKVDSMPVKRWQAGFVLSGSADQGELQVLSPLGNVLALAQWQVDSAVLEQGSRVERFGNVKDMAVALTGADIPLNALFGWLKGIDTEVDGWTLSRPSNKLLIAQRQSPSPEISLRISLNN